MLVGLAGLALLLATYTPMQAAVELSFYNVLVLPTGVVLEWQTASEYDLIGFEVWYKEESASQSSYTLLGKRIAQGSPQHGVTYRMDVTALLEAETTYCFQLRELPINGERGEILNRCGYGLGISAQPTPTPTPLFTPTSAFTSTTILTSTIRQRSLCDTNDRSLCHALRRSLCDANNRSQPSRGRLSNRDTNADWAEFAADTFPWCVRRWHFPDSNRALCDDTCNLCGQHDGCQCPDGAG